MNEEAQHTNTQTHTQTASAQKLTVIGRIVIRRTVQPDRAQVRYGVQGRTLVNAVALGQHVHVVKHFVHGGGRLVDGADDGAPFAGQPLQQLDRVQ